VIKESREALWATPTPTVVCLHSSTRSPLQWNPLIERLRGRYRVIAPALHGHKSGVPLPSEWMLTLDDEARLVEEVIDGSAGAVHLVGHSYGAAVALKVALRNSSRLLSLTLFEPTLPHLLRERLTDHGAYVEFAYLRVALQSALRSSERLAQLVVDYWSGRGAWSNLSTEERERFIRGLPTLNANFDALFGQRTPLAEYARIGVPTLLLVGANTPFPSERITSLLGATLPRATVRPLAGVGHMGPVSHARKVNHVIQAYLDERHAEMGWPYRERAANDPRARAA
jgi:pimeloyl-ACP methyl ester carboxylesterase